MRLMTFLFAILVASPVFADPLPSWNDTASKARIVAFVEDVTDPAAETFVPEEARIAVFDNDGTLWSEQPVYFQFLYAIDRLREKAEADPSILTSDVLRAAAAGDIRGAMAGGNEGLLDIVNVSHSGLSVDAFDTDVRAWLAAARHPTSGLPYTGMTYQPMLELLSYLRDEGFTTYIVSGGGVHFMRAFAADAYTIPPWQVIGSAGHTRYDVVNGEPILMKDPGIAFIDDGPGKPAGIDAKIGVRPIFVGGNSDGDFQMLEWATSGAGPRFGMIVHHTDADREFAYDRQSAVGRLDRALDEAEARDWLVVDMARDWSRVWSGQP
ncbi:HAD family hydrolase [Marinivivus vitaminiproducens]|uniref:HAD family hydrolase n=1 Tax=Marinivivus vitaminiproducens TaxID=3035935 RepID=UPI0027A73D35|nr:HAD family hydrolase [Geminicoccaceae bacterium SCSIO 64248]